MTPQQYRTHPNVALRRAFRSGELVGLAGVSTVNNPYRRQAGAREPKRGSWSESYARAWALGVDEGMRELALIRRRELRDAE